MSLRITFYRNKGKIFHENICSDNIHETTYEERKTQTGRHSPEPTVKKSTVNRELVGIAITQIIYSVINSFIISIVKHL